MHLSSHRHAAGDPHPFTLIELLVVIAIVVVLASMLLPALTRARETAKRIACVNQERQVMVSLLGYADDFQSWFPQVQYSRPMIASEAIYWVKDYLPDYKKLLRCPKHQTIFKQSAAYDPVFLGTDMIMGYQFAAGYGDYPNPATGGYWFGWQSSGWVSTQASPSATCPNINFTGSIMQGKYVAAPDQQPGLVEGHIPNSPTWANGSAATYVRHHDGGENVACVDGHVEYRADHLLKLRYRSLYW